MQQRSYELEICTGLVRCSRPVPTAVIPVPVPQWSILLPSHSHSFHSRPSPVAFIPTAVPVPLKSVGEKTKLKILFKRSTLHDDMCNNGRSHRQLWTKYIVHIMLHKKHDKYRNNGKCRPNSSNNRPTIELGLIPGPTGLERLLLPVPRDSRSSQSHSRHSRGMKGGRSSHSRDTPAVFPQDFTAPAPVQNSTMSTWSSYNAECYAIQHRTVLIIFSLIIETVVLGTVLLSSAWTAATVLFQTATMWWTCHDVMSLMHTAGTWVDRASDFSPKKCRHCLYVCYL